MPRHKGVRIVLALATILIVAELAYLAYANLKLPAIIASLSASAGLRAQYARAYSLYPGHVDVWGVKLAGAGDTPYWSTSLTKLEARPIWSDVSGTWVTRITILPQAMRARVGSRELSATTFGEIRVADLFFSRVSPRLEGGFVNARGLEIALPKGTPLTLSQADLTLSQANITLPPRDAAAKNGQKNLQDMMADEGTIRAEGTIHAEGADASRLLEALQIGGAVPWLFPQLAGAPFKLNGDFTVGSEGVRVSALHARAEQVEVRGELMWSDHDLSGAILLSAAQTRVGLVLAEGKVELVLSPKDSWLRERLVQANQSSAAMREE